MPSSKKPFISSLESIGDILAFETRRRNKNKTVEDSLEKIREFVVKLLEISKENPEKFERILFSEEFLDLKKRNPTEAGLRLSMVSRFYTEAFTAAINQIIRVHEAAIEARNPGLSTQATYSITHLIADLSKYPNNEIFIQQLLGSLGKITKFAIKNSDISVYPASFDWYIGIVFNKLYQSKEMFLLSYLPVYDQYFFSTIKLIVSNNNLELFESLVGSLHDSISPPLTPEMELWEYSHKILSLNRQAFHQLDSEFNINNDFLQNLGSKRKYIRTMDELKSWFKEFEKMKNALLNSTSKCNT